VPLPRILELTVRRTTLATALAALTAAPLMAQSLWLVPEGRTAMLLEVLRPDFAGGGLGTLSTAWYLTGRFALSSRLAVQAEVPFAYTTLDNPSPVSDVSEAGFGNPYLGLVLSRPGSGWWGEFGARLPVGADNGSALVGVFSDVDRFEAWLASAVPLQVLAGYRWSWESGAFILLRGGPAVWINTADGGESEVASHAAVQGGWQGQRLALAAAVTTLTAITADGGFGERSLVQGGVLAEARFGNLRPGITVFLPIDEDLGDLLSLVLGLRVAVLLP
jgi:hypothetical protein